MSATAEPTIARVSPDDPAAGISVPILAGLSLMGGAFALDVAVHAASLTAVEPAAHVAGVLGMGLTWGAVVIDGLRRTARRA